MPQCCAVSIRIGGCEDGHKTRCQHELERYCDSCYDLHKVAHGFEDGTQVVITKDLEYSNSSCSVVVLYITSGDTVMRGYFKAFQKGRIPAHLVK